MSSRVSKQPQVSKIKYFIEIGSDIEIQSDQARRTLRTHTSFIMTWAVMVHMILQAQYSMKRKRWNLEWTEFL